MKYDLLIESLEDIVENWYDREELIKHIKEPCDGLCDNIKSGLLGEGVPKECITSWVYFNGDSWFPVGGGDEYARGEKEPYSLFNNPKRLHLALHMLQWLKFNNV